MTNNTEELKERHINEIAKDLCSRYAICTCVVRDGHCQTPQQHAKILYGLGYKKQITGSWSNYSSTMMECSNCKKHVPYHRYTFCPHCGSKNRLEA
jgi:rRNA maturation endonuclease Nob1